MQTSVQDSVVDAEAHLVRAVRGVLAAPRVLQMYPAGHPRIEAHLAGLAEVFDALFVLTREPVSFTVRGMKLDVNGKLLLGAGDLGGRLAYQMSRRRIRTLTLHPGLTQDEVRWLAELLVRDQRTFLREGGIEARLAEQDLPHVAAEALRNTGTGADLSRLGLPGHVLEALETDEFGDRLDGVRRILGEVVASGPEERDFQDLLAELFQGVDWSGMAPDDVRHTFDLLIDRLEEGLREAFDATGTADADAIAARIAALKSLFQDLTRDTAAAAGRDPDLDENTVDYAVAGVVELVGELETEGAVDALKRRHASHDVAENALSILGDVLMSAAEPDEYRTSREAFLVTAAKTRSALMLHHILVAAPTPQFEERSAFVRAVLQAAPDHEPLFWLLTTFQRLPPAFGLVLDALTGGADRFGPVARALSLKLARPVRDAVGARLTQLAEDYPDALRTWARQFPDAFLDGVCGVLLARSPARLTECCRDVLARGDRRDRKALVELLRADGSEPALLLVLQGLPTDGEPCDPLVLDALAAFRHALAVRTLADVVRRGNATGDVEEAATALRLLHRVGTGAARTFLREVVESRRLLLHTFGGKLRAYARALLEGGRA